MNKKELKKIKSLDIHLGKSTSSKSIACISDMHCGSYYAIASPQADCKPNPYQTSTYTWWLDCRDACGKVDALTENGEPINGPSKKANGWQNWTSDGNEQLDDAEFLLREWRYDKILLTRGSGYHIQDGCTNAEEALARRLNATKYSLITKNFVDDELFLTPNGQLFNAAHHIGFSKLEQYRTTSIAREMCNLIFLKNKYYNGELKVITRGHVHYFVRVEYSSSIGFTTPAWKYADTHLKRGGMAGTMPSIGMILLIVEPNGDTIVEKHIMPDEKIPKQRPISI